MFLFPAVCSVVTPERSPEPGAARRSRLCRLPPASGPPPEAALPRRFRRVAFRSGRRPLPESGNFLSNGLPSRKTVYDYVLPALQSEPRRSTPICARGPYVKRGQDGCEKSLSEGGRNSRPYLATEMQMASDLVVRISAVCLLYSCSSLLSLLQSDAV